MEYPQYKYGVQIRQLFIEFIFIDDDTSYSKELLEKVKIDKTLELVKEVDKYAAGSPYKIEFMPWVDVETQFNYHACNEEVLFRRLATLDVAVVETIYVK